MSKPASLSGRLTLVCLCLLVSVGLLLLRCTSGSPPASAGLMMKTGKVAHLTMLNSSDCEWRIVITAAAGGKKYVWRLPVVKSGEVDLEEGDYAVEQTMLTGGPESGATRRFSMRLAGGQSYRWRLMTLFSDEMIDTRLSKEAKDGHE